MSEQRRAPLARSDGSSRTYNLRLTPLGYACTVS